MSPVRFVFVWLNYNMHVSFGHGIGILSAVAKMAGAESVVYHVHTAVGNPPDITKCAKDIMSMNPTIVGIGSSTLEWQFATNLAREIKRISSAIIVAGGPHPTFASDRERFDAFDFVIVGEGEKVVQDFASGKSPKEKIVTGPLVENLDALPFADRESFDMPKIIEARNGIVDFITTRGCPFNCRYCSNQTLRSLYGKAYLRRRSVEKAIEEIELVAKRYSSKMIFFHDDTFTLKRDWNWVVGFCSAYKEQIGKPFIINSRVGNLSPHILKMLKMAGCVEIKLGIESGDEGVRRNILGRVMRDEDILKTFDMVRMSGIRSYAYFIHGIPGSPKDAHKKDILMVAKAMPNVVRSSIFFPLPNTVLGDQFGRGSFDGASMIGDNPSSLIDKTGRVLRGFYTFPWEINIALGLDEYRFPIEDLLEEKTFSPEKIRQLDILLSEKMKKAGKRHYHFGQECSMIKLWNGEEPILF